VFGSCDVFGSMDLEQVRKLGQVHILARAGSSTVKVHSILLFAQVRNIWVQVLVHNKPVLVHNKLVPEHSIVEHSDDHNERLHWWSCKRKLPRRLRA
jgi:hypothetical protein